MPLFTRDMKIVNGNRFLGAVLLSAVIAVQPAVLGAQKSSLTRAVERAQGAWLEHAVAILVASSDTVRLHIPGVVPSASLRPGQAARLLERYLKPAQERTFVLRDVRTLAPDHAYAEVERVYVVRGTTEEREETVFLGFRLVHGKWSLREVRVTP